MTNKTLYSAGFLFNRNRSEVVLIEKNKPEKFKGMLNAVGGKIEEGETPLQCMIREFKEETGADVNDWKEFVLLKNKNYEVHFFVAEADDTLFYSVKSITDEKVGTYMVSEEAMCCNVIPNIRWLLMMCWDDKHEHSICEVE